jgi:histidine triad (HIT) family protein
MTIFQKIVAREIPAEILYEDSDLLAFRDISPQAPVHVLIVPKEPLPRIAAAKADHAKLLANLLLRAQALARELGVEESGYRLVINNGPNGGETVPHLHVHLLGGRPFHWPPG